MDNLDREQRWQYYVSSYMQIEPTEGVDRTRVGKSVLPRNLPSANDSDSESGEARRSIHYHEGLTLMVCTGTSKISYEKGTVESHVFGSNPALHGDDAEGEGDAPAVKDASAAATEVARQEELQGRREASGKQKLKEKMIMNQPWMRDLNRDDVQKQGADANKWLFEDGALPGAEARGD